MKFASLFNKGKPLTVTRLVNVVKECAFKVLTDDNSIIEKSTWYKSSGHSKETYRSIDMQRALLFEREILTLACARIIIFSLKHNNEILREAIIELGKQNFHLRNWIPNSSELKFDEFLDIIYDKGNFYLDELLKYYEIENHDAINLLFHLYNPLTSVDFQPTLKQKVNDAYLSARFKMVTIPLLKNELPKPFVNKS